MVQTTYLSTQWASLLGMLTSVFHSTFSFSNTYRSNHELKFTCGIPLKATTIQFVTRIKFIFWLSDNYFKIYIVQFCRNIHSISVGRIAGFDGFILSREQFFKLFMYQLLSFPGNMMCINSRSDYFISYPWPFQVQFSCSSDHLFTWLRYTWRWMDLEGCS